MRSFLTTAALAVCLCTGAAAQKSPAPEPAPAENSPNQLVIEKPLAPGGTVVFEMNVGDLKILPAPAQSGVRLEIHAGESVSPETIASWVKRFDVAADRATLEIRIPKDHEHYGGTDVVLYVPEQTELKINLGVGDLTLRGIRGDKELHLGIGDLRIGVANLQEYAHVEVHTHLGDINDSLNHGLPTGFLGKSEDLTLHGRFHLKAFVGIGDLDLFEEGKS